MKILTSYFYAVRFMRPWQIPVSTAVFDPKWFHAFKGQDHVFFDKNRVINGLRSEKLRPGKACAGLCSGSPCQFSPDSCAFMSEYRKQLFALDRNVLVKSFYELTARMQAAARLEQECEIILLVHEAPDNPCSERKAIREFFECGEFDWRNAI